MNKFISIDDIGLEVGAGAGFSKNFINNKNFKICDIESHDHLDLKMIDAQNTGFDTGNLDFVIASNMLHHVAFPLKFLNEMHRILKPGGKLIIQEAYCSIIFQIITIIMRHRDLISLKMFGLEKKKWLIQMMLGLVILPFRI